MVLCIVVGCGNRTGAAHKHREKVGFFRVPRVITHQGRDAEELTSARRREWLSAISRADLTEEKLQNERVCGKHFVSGQPSKEWERFNVDWAPTVNLGHSKKGDAVTGAGRAERAERTTRRRKLREDHLQAEVTKKVKRSGKSTTNNCPDEPMHVPASNEQDLTAENCPDPPVNVPAPNATPEDPENCPDQPVNVPAPNATPEDPEKLS
ncbi:Hypp1336 [Branchiostoma lanceolatum]|uniref:Hypp1336 protein n=1 Tax=Branchiostoma lanceolatum TaxID=7740 RepID=A0A8J9ZIZ3_BRALA|nr:Hypp1336 [Branchiostoma lanceolatum]